MHDMAPSGFKLAFTLAIIFSLSLLLPKSGQGGDGLMVLSESSASASSKGKEEGKVVIGSKPPVCVNKCMKCRPCMATVVVNDHQKKKGFKVDLNSHGGSEDDTYYLLSWKCRCGNKLFQP